MAYFDTKKGSLEEAIKSAVSGKINEASIYLDGHGEEDTGEGMRDFSNLTKKLNLKFKNIPFDIYFQFFSTIFQ